MKALIPIEVIEKKIFLLRGQKVMLDKDLAELYGVSTKVLNQAVKRNLDRFPEDFMFQLTKGEADAWWQSVMSIRLRSQFVTLKRGQHIKHSPYAFTEYGILMLSSVLNSERTVQVNIIIMRTFVRLRRLLASNEELARKLHEMEKKYDEQFKVVFDAIRQLLQPLDESSTTLRVDRPVGSHRPEKPKRQIGFKVEEPKMKYIVRKRKP